MTHQWIDSVHNVLRSSTLMHEDDMSFMCEVFIPDAELKQKPRLPFNEYIVNWGLHPMSVEVREKAPHLSALSYMRKKYGDSFQCRYNIPRPDGTFTELSVISGMMFYCRKDAPYEVMIYGGKSDGDPLPYQTDEDLMLLIAKLLGESDGL